MKASDKVIQEVCDKICPILADISKGLGNVAHAIWARTYDEEARAKAQPEPSSVEDKIYTSDEIDNMTDEQYYTYKKITHDKIEELRKYLATPRMKYKFEEYVKYKGEHVLATEKEQK